MLHVHCLHGRPAGLLLSNILIRRARMVVRAEFARALSMPLTNLHFILKPTLGARPYSLSIFLTESWRSTMYHGMGMIFNYQVWVI